MGNKRSYNEHVVAMVLLESKHPNMVP